MLSGSFSHRFKILKLVCYRPDNATKIDSFRILLKENIRTVAKQDSKIGI